MRPHIPLSSVELRGDATSLHPSASILASKISAQNISQLRPFSLRLRGSTFIVPSDMVQLLPFQLWAAPPRARRAVWGRRRPARSPLRPRSFILRVVATFSSTLAPCGKFTLAIFSRSRGVINPARPWVALPRCRSQVHRSPLLVRGCFRMGGRRWLPLHLR